MAAQARTLRARALGAALALGLSPLAGSAASASPLPVPGPDGPTTAISRPVAPRVVPAGEQAHIETCWGSTRRVWLTFDDGGSPAQVHRILRVLRAARVRAIFFPIGSWAAGHPGLMHEIAAAGHVIGDHTRDHVDLSRESDSGAAWQIEHGVHGNATPAALLRPPFGDGAYSGRLADLAAAAGMRLCTWTVDTRDWTGASADAIVRRVRSGEGTSPPVRAGGVVLMHMQGEHTGAALPRVIRAVRARGLRLQQPG